MLKVLSSFRSMEIIIKIFKYSKNMYIKQLITNTNLLENLLQYCICYKKCLLSNSRNFIN